MGRTGGRGGRWHTDNGGGGEEEGRAGKQKKRVDMWISNKHFNRIDYALGSVTLLQIMADVNMRHR